jgi:hypothetical protein
MNLFLLVGIVCAQFRLMVENQFIYFKWMLVVLQIWILDSLLNEAQHFETF